MTSQEVQFKTIDGLTLSGRLYPGSGPVSGRAIILTGGFATVKEMFVPDIAAHFQHAGITALTYDPRCTGASEGEPRQELDPHKQVSDYSDALTFLASQPGVDPSRIGFWGFSFGGIVALSAATLDSRVRWVVACCPLTNFTFDGKRARVLARTMRDRESIIKGNPPFSLPVLTEEGLNPAGFGGAADANNYRLIMDAFRNAPTYENRTTLQTYYKIAGWNPLGLVSQLDSASVLLLTPQDDIISTAEDQTKLFDSIGANVKKHQHFEPEKGHMNIFAGESFARLMQVQIEFLQD
ncbi:uncharacterized protein N7500_001688 [Penicillium coprophilum]|uniref:uncharacterized protein n=1 Tax=Penicillium coprophilum TaxID=36646 RepID=UPI00238EC75B|nr:uncharacterized protein N7500_001688 [Penicillium coprophilum]KAJ5173757.1 hypothetical protein N7500_001688 [Penicillium coprophilum]